MKTIVNKEDRDLITFITYKIMFSVKIACVAIYDLIPAAVHDYIYYQEIKRKLNILVTKTDRYDDFLRKIYGRKLDYFNECFVKITYQVQDNINAYKAIVLDQYRKCEYANTRAQMEVAVNLLNLANINYQRGMDELHHKNKKLPYLVFFEMTKIQNELLNFNKYLLSQYNFRNYDITNSDKNEALNILSSKLDSRKIIFHCINEKNKNSKKYWTDYEFFYLKNNYVHRKSTELSKIMGRPVTQLYYVSGRLKIYKSTAVKSITAKDNWKELDYPGKKNQFNKGHIPANKGLKQTDYMSADAIERTKKTRFQKGHKPANMVEVGTKIIDGDGYEIIKIANPSTWEYTHRLIWKKYNGDIPQGYVVRIKDGNKTHLTIDNLELISLKENMMKNSIHRYPNELRNTIMALGALNRKLNNKLKKLNK